MNGAETGALPLNMVTASEPSPTRRMGARALAALAALAAACFPNPPGVRGVAGTAPTPSVFWTPPRERGARDTTRPAPAVPPELGGRSGSIGEAREALLAADWTHNAVIQNVVLGVESAYFGYMATKALLVAQQTTLKEAQANLQAAEERHRVGLATIADVLQAKTARSRAQLTLETTQGALQTTRGALALSMGLPANVPYDVAIPPDTLPPLGITDSVDTLIERAVRERPDLAAARAEARGIHARVSVARAQALPSLVVSGSTGETYFLNTSTFGNSYTASIGIQIPLFSGWSQSYGVKAAAAAARAAEQRAHGMEQQVIFQVFDAYSGLRTATQQVRTSADLLASATQSEQVALGRYKAGAGSLLDLLTAQVP